MKPPSIVLTGRSLKRRTAATSLDGFTVRLTAWTLSVSRPSTSEASAAAGVVAVLGEVGVAGAAAGDRGEQVLVVAAADADGRADDPGPLGARRELLERGVVGDPDVGVAVGEQDQVAAPSSVATRCSSWIPRR